MKSNLKSKGFSHHFLLPLLVVFMIGGIGSYVMLRNSSAMTESSGGSGGSITNKITKSCSGLTFSKYQHNTTRYKSCVKAIQRKVGITGTAVDGIYGSNTQAKVKTWQSNHGLSADGVVGSKTWKAMGLHTTYSYTTINKQAVAAKKKACNATYGMVWSSSKNTCENKAKACKEKSGSYLWAEGDKKCYKEKTTTYTYVDVNYCEWKWHPSNYTNMGLECHTKKNVIKGSSTESNLVSQNNKAWDTCRSFVKGKNIPGATTTAQCENLRF